MSVKVSVVVPTYRRPQLLERCLEALAAQDYPAGDYEVLVVDAADAAATREQVERWNWRIGTSGKGPVFSYLAFHNGNHGPAAARNAGWKAAQGRIIAFTDDDCLPMRDWLTCGTGAFTRGVIGASGRLIMPLPDQPTDYEKNAAELTGAAYVTANCFYRREALRSAGGFDERFETAWREDSDLFFTLAEMHGLDGRFVRAENAVVVHPIRPAAWGVSLKQQKKTMYNALLYKKHPQLYRKSVQPGPPWHYYGILAAFLGILAGAAFGRSRMVMIFGLTWFILTGRFALKRLDGTAHTPTHVAEMAATSAVVPFLSVFWRIVGAIRYRTLFF